MKTSHKLIGAALLAAAGVAVALPNATKAAPFAGDDAAWTGSGQITFQKNNTGGTITPPDETGPALSETDINTGDKDLKIRFVSSLDFDQHDVLTDNQVKTYNAKRYVSTDLATGDPVEMPNFVNFQDYRTEEDNNFYTIKAEITKEFTRTDDATKKLAGATLTYGNARLTTTTNANTMPSQAAVIGAASPVGYGTGGQQVIVENKEAGKGYGMFDIAFGTLDAGAEAGKLVADESVKLTIPGDVILSAGTYQAEVTWTIEEAN